ncbi:MAG: hypothetical protein JSS26_05775 [Nitrospira sp.]|nr:hypothetical protein [Nitrospira sp.]
MPQAMSVTDLQNAKAMIGTDPQAFSNYMSSLGYGYDNLVNEMIPGNRKGVGSLFLASVRPSGGNVPCPDALALVLEILPIMS